MSDIVQALSKKMVHTECDLIVRREHVLEDVMRQMKRRGFNPSHAFKVLSIRVKHAWSNQLEVTVPLVGAFPGRGS